MCVWLLERKLFYLDPHRVHPFVDFSSNVDNMDETFHCVHPSYMDVSHLDPSIAIVCFFWFSLLPSFLLQGEATSARLVCPFLRPCYFGPSATFPLGCVCFVYVA